MRPTSPSVFKLSIPGSYHQDVNGSWWEYKETGWVLAGNEPRFWEALLEAARTKRKAEFN